MTSTPQPRAPRISPVTELDESQRELVAKAPVRADGAVPNIFLTLAQSPLLLKRFNAFAGTFFISDLVSAYDRELIVLRAASHVGSRYEYAQHLSIARDAGLSDPVIRAAMRQPDAPPVSDADQLLLDATDQFIADGDISDVIWGQLSVRYSDAALLHVLFIIGLYRMTGEILNTVGITPEEEPDLAMDWGS
jgi:4-carboxymuconolactone decarboxylase